MLWMYKRIIFGKIVNENLKELMDVKKVELFILWCLAFPVIFFGFYPEPLINTIEVSIQNLLDIYNFNLTSYQAKTLYD